MSRLTRNITKIMTIMIFTVTVLTAVTTSVFEMSFYEKSQTKYNVAERMNITDQQLLEATTVALAYTKGLTNDLTYNIVDGDKTYDLYSSQDKEHMIDVANLYKFAYNVLVFCAIGTGILALILVLKRKEVTVFSVTLLMNQVSLYALIFVAVLGIFAYTNFDVFWVMFHKVFFTNDLWFMDGTVDALVNLFPQGLFMDLVFKIITRFVFLFATFNVGAFLYRAYSLREVKHD